MHFKERLCLAFTAITFSTAGLLLIILAVPFVSFDNIRTGLNFLEGNIILVLSGAFFLTISILMFLAALKKKRSSRYIKQVGQLGEVRISFSAIESLVMKEGYQNRGIEEIKTKIIPGKAGLNIALRLTVLPGTNIPETTEKLQVLMKNYLEEMTGAIISEVKVLVEKVTPRTNPV